jgi:hypothetical protein
MYVLNEFKRSTPPQNRQLVVCNYSLKTSVDDFVGELTSQNNPAAVERRTVTGLFAKVYLTQCIDQMVVER